MNASFVRAATIVLLAAFATASARAQEPVPDGRFVTGPLAWTPTLELRDVGVDSNVFNTPTDAKEDVTASARSQVDSVLKLGLLRATTVGSLEYNLLREVHDAAGPQPPCGDGSRDSGRAIQSPCQRVMGADEGSFRQ